MSSGQYTSMASPIDTETGIVKRESTVVRRLGVRRVLRCGWLALQGRSKINITQSLDANSLHAAAAKMTVAGVGVHACNVFRFSLKIHKTLNELKFGRRNRAGGGAGAGDVEFIVYFKFALV